MSTGSADNIPDGVPLNDIELIKRRFSLDDKAAEAVRYIMQNVQVANLSQIVGADYALRHLIVEIERGSGMIKLRALELLMRGLGLFTPKKKSSAKKVVFDDGV